MKIEIINIETKVEKLHDGAWRPLTNFSTIQKEAYEKAIARHPEYKLKIGPASDFNGRCTPLSQDLCLYRIGHGDLSDFWETFRTFRV